MNTSVVLERFSGNMPDEYADEAIQGAREAIWLSNSLERIVRYTRERRERLKRPGVPDALGAAMLRDASVQVDVAAAVYRLVLEQAGGGLISLSDCLALASAVALEPLRLRQRSNLEFYLEPDCIIPAEHALAVVAMSLEAIINAVHHAHPTGIVGRLSIACRRNGDVILLEISDDGVGLPEGFDVDDDAGVGLRSIFDGAEAIGAKVAFESGPLGLTLRVRMRAAAAPAVTASA